MQTLENAISQGMDELGGLLPDLIAAALVVVLAFGLGHVAGGTIDRFADDRKEGLPTARLTKRLVRWTFVLIGIVLALQILGLTAVAASLLATGGFAAVVLGFAFREIGENLLAGLVLGMSRSFEVGDLIESSGFMGEVKDIEVRHVHVRTADGRDVFIPSAAILRNALVNLTRDDLRRGDFQLGIDYRDSLEQALQLVFDATRAIEEVLEEPELRVRVEEFEPQYVTIRVLFWVRTDSGPGLAAVRSEVMRACLGALLEGGMTVSAEVSSALTMAPVEVTLARE